MTPLPSLVESRQLIQVDDCDEMMIGEEVSRESQHGILFRQHPELVPRFMI